MDKHLKAGFSEHLSTCCYCGVGCGVSIQKDPLGRIWVEGEQGHPVNQGQLCSKGMNLHHTVNDTSDRLLYPEVRFGRSQPRQRVSWDIALERTAAVFSSLIEKYGPDSVAFYASGQCLTEEYYVINKLIKGYIGSNNIDTNSRLCMSSAVVGYKMSLGEDSVPASYEDLDLADVIFVAGANPAWCHPILWRRVEAAKERNPNLKIIVSDPRKTQTCSIADVHLQLNPGTDIVLHHAIGRSLIEMGAIDVAFVSNHTEGFTQYQESVMQRTLEEAAELCGVSINDILTTASYIKEAKGFMTMWTMGLNQSAVGVSKNLSLINLNLITGQIGRPGAGPLSLTGQPNAMGGREVGGLSNLLPAHRDLLNPDHRAEVEDFWSVPRGRIAPKPGLSATEMFEALESGKLKAVWIICTNPLISMPDVRRVEQAFKKAKFVVVQDISNKVETLAYADVVLPAASWAEKEGTMTNAERRVSYLPKVLNAPGEALPDAEIICRFAQKMGFKGFDFNHSADIYAEHVQLTQGTNVDMSGLSHALLKEKRTLQWPYIPGQSDQGTARLFSDNQFYTSSQKAQIHTVSDENTSEKVSNEFPLILTTGRIRDQWHTMSKTGKVNKLKQHIHESFLEIHPDDAAQLGIQDQSLVEIKNNRGEVRVKAKLSSDIKKGVVFLPMHWGKLGNMDLNRANNLTNNLVDPKSKEPDFKFSAVSVKAYKKTKQKIIVVGAGAGACGFVKSYRQYNTDDSIEVFSKENLPFYNRVLLPDYINGTLPWINLVKMSEEEELEHQFTLHRGVWITSVNREEKRVVDNLGRSHHYDVLILATGSRPALLRDIPDLAGVFTMRSRMDADRFLAHIDPKQGSVLIVGGGLLGIELAASLQEMQVKVTIIHRNSRFMDRQLDPLGSQLLHEELVDRGIGIHYNDEIERFLGEENIAGVRLKSGLTLTCQAMVIAIGTIPNIELAKEAGIKTQRGICVDAYLQTNDPSIHAIGEIAECDGSLFGITAAAEQQAEIVARYLSGDISAQYSGSLLMNILKMHGTDFCSMGIIELPQNPAFEEVVFIDKAKRYYKKCIIHNDRLVGAILIGDKREFLEFKNLIENKIELSEKRLQLLRAGEAPEPVIGKLICSCNGVGEGNLVKKIDAGCTDHLQLCQLSGAGMGCGSCRPEVKSILDRTLKMKQHERVLE
ncbi:nitrate reductase [Aquirufa ecclesiirivi]|uniref:nitrate reductase n=1 Tax=Aquirufa ecclesiirivi TaxID=2715124 RepID=UPI00140BE0FB|nr:nitrate reductase [Aquirufa ecclesiirivi]NHC49912.1 molybdopterin-dependent oxidoreductase [Aquirufa ecclesiirivi]